MSQIPSTDQAGSNSLTQQDANDALRGLDMDQFLNLFIAELQNQDPLNPMENAQILEQISQIREVGATTQLSDTVEALAANQEKEVEAVDALTAAIGSVLLGQNLTSATSLIGKEITAARADGTEITGEVDKVSIVDGLPQLHIGEETVSLFGVKEVLS